MEGKDVGRGGRQGYRSSGNVDYFGFGKTRTTAAEQY